MPTMDALSLRAEADGLPALRTTLGLDELGPVPGELRPDMYRPRIRFPEPVGDPGPAKPVAV
jgi:hypothetical protein